MHTQIKQLSFTLLTGLVLNTALAMAETNTTTAPSTIPAKTNEMELLNMAGKQRMLSQRIAKNYFYKGMGVNTSKSNKQLQESITQFNHALKKLDQDISDRKIKKMILFVTLSNDDFISIASEKFTLENSTIVLDLSESMLEGSQYIVRSIEESSTKQTSSLIDMSGKQRMLSQRIAKYYISYQAGIKDKNSITQMKKAVEEFSAAQTKLMENKSNSQEINKKLNEVNKLWKIVYDFYLDIEEGGLPVIVYNTTDNIMKKMDKITQMYIALQK